MAVMKSPKNTRQKKVWILRKSKKPLFQNSHVSTNFYRKEFKSHKVNRNLLERPRLSWRNHQFRKRRRVVRRKIFTMYIVDLLGITQRVD